MNEDLENLQYSQILDINYKEFFQDIHFNGKTLNDTERKKYIRDTDETISFYSEGLPLINDILKGIEDKKDNYHIIYRKVLNVSRFCLITSIDCMVISKYFMLADKDYDRRFMRGKMKVILNEGFKRLYGFNKDAHKKPEWQKITGIIDYFPKKLKDQYQEITSHLDEYSKSSWWKKEREAETHLDIQDLYNSRCEEINESKVMMESIKLYNTLLAVDTFLLNMNSCFDNTLIQMYKNGQLIEE